MLFQAWVAMLIGILINIAPFAIAQKFDPSQLINLNLVTQINAFITLESLVDNLVSVNFDVKNTLFVPLVIQKISTNAGLNGTTFATFNHTFVPPFTINPGRTVNSGNISNVLLPQGAVASLSIIPFGILDIDSDILAIEIVPIPINGLKQSSVPTNYTLELS